MHTYETLKAKTVEELKAMCKDLGLRGYSDLNEDDLIEKLLSSGKLEKLNEIKENEENESEEEAKLKAKEEKEETSLSFKVLRPVKTSTLGDVRKDFSMTKDKLEKDIKLQKAIKLGFVVKV